MRLMEISTIPHAFETKVFKANNFLSHFFEDTWTVSQCCFTTKTKSGAFMIRLRLLPLLDALIVTHSQVENRLAKQPVLCTCLCLDIMSLMIYSQSRHKLLLAPHTQKKLQSKVTSVCSLLVPLVQDADTVWFWCTQSRSSYTIPYKNTWVWTVEVAYWPIVCEMHCCNVWYEWKQ